MEIDLSSIIIGIIALSFFFVPIIYFEYYKNRTTKKISAHFNEIASQNNITLTQFDVWCNQYGIGIDKNTHSILYLNKKNGQDETIKFDLSDKKVPEIKAKRPDKNT